MDGWVSPTTIAEIQDFIRSQEHVHVVGRQTKALFPVIYSTQIAPQLSLSQWQAVLDYDPSEFTITAKAGTPLQEIQRELAKHGQYMPFDPPLVQEGATLGGAIAAGVSGPCRLRYGGIRDFVLGARLIDGTGQVATVGGKVVKNAAGFDIPKLMVGSWGQLGVMLEVTLKVFPKPEVYQSIVVPGRQRHEAISLVEQLARCPIELDGLDVAEDMSVIVRVGGTPEAAQAAAERVYQIVKHQATIYPSGEEETRLWQDLLSWTWHRPDDVFLRAPIVSKKISELMDIVERFDGRCRLSVAGNVAWLSIPPVADWQALHAAMSMLDVSLRRLRAGPENIGRCFGRPVNQAFSERVTLAFDPRRKFSMRPPDPQYAKNAGE